MSLKYFVAGLVMLAVIILMKGYFDYNFVSLIVLIGCGMFIYVAMLFILRDKFFLGLVNQAINIIKSLIKKFNLKLSKN